MGAVADPLARVFHVLSDPMRTRLVRLLLDGEKNVGELASALGASHGRASSYLMRLRWCGFVTARRAGEQVYHRVGDRRAAAMVRPAHGLLRDHAQAIATSAVIDRGA